MTVKVEVNVWQDPAPTNTPHVFRATLSRVPITYEIIRVLVTVNGMTEAQWFRVIRVVHNVATPEYPSGDAEAIEAWVNCYPIAKEW